MAEKISISKSDLVDYYYNKNLNQKEIARIFNVHVGTIEQRFSEFKLKGRTYKYSLNEDKISESYLEMWYFLGLFAADGWLSPSHGVNIGLRSKGGEILLQQLIDHFEYTGTILNYKATGARVSFRSKTMYNWLLAHNIPEKDKTLTLDITTLDFKTEANFRNFVRGYFDGDGSISPIIPNDGLLRLRYMRILSFTKEAIFPIGKLIEKYLNLKCSFQSNIRDKYYQIEITKIDDVLKFLDWIYKDKDQKLKLRGKYYLYKIAKMMI